MRNTVSSYVIHFYDEYHSWVYCGDYFEVYQSTETLSCIIGANTVLQANHTTKTSKKLRERETRSAATRGKGRGEGDWVKAV